MPVKRNFNPTFCDLNVNLDNVNRLVTSFIESNYFALFLGNFALNNMQVSYL